MNWDMASHGVMDSLISLTALDVVSPSINDFSLLVSLWLQLNHLPYGLWLLCLARKLNDILIKAVVRPPAVEYKVKYEEKEMTA
jgi:hypothetical protein